MKTKIYTLLLLLFASSLLSQNVRMVKDINLGANHSIPQYLTPLNDKFYFSAFDADYGNELWVSDGTTNGTSLLKDIRVADFDFQDSDSNPSYLTRLGDKIFFFANDGSGIALWETDGTTAGTRIAVKKDENNANISSFRYMVAYNNKLYFSASIGTTGLELFVSDGTENGTKMLKDINPQPLEGSQPKSFKVYKNNLYFTASDRTNGRELWVTNGTESGTKLLKDISIGTYGSNPKYFEIFNDKLYFSATDGNQPSNNGRELWVTEGNENNTVLVKNISLGSQGSNPSYLKTLNDKMYFVASAENNDAELWETDGTSAGTQLFKNLNGNSLSSDIRYLTLYNDKLYFQAAEDFENGLELWETDGTFNGTKLTEDINSGNANSDPKNFTVFNNKLYFSANNGMQGIELFVHFNGPKTYIPDDNFEQALIDLGYDDVLDDYVITDNIKTVTNLELANKEIEDLTGIEGFTELISLNINNNLISELDISNNEKLYNLSANNNTITTLEITNNYKLYGLSLKGNGLTSLRLTGIFDLADVDVSENNLTSLNLNAARALIGIKANDNNLSILKLKTGNSNNIQVFDTRNNSNLMCIEIDNIDHANQILINKDNYTNFSLGCDYAGEIYVPDANFESALIALRLDDIVDEKVLKANIENIEKLEINDWNISDLTGIHGFTALKELNVNNNNLTTLSTSQNTALQVLKANNNTLSELITSNNLQLQTVDVSYNNFATLSLSSSAGLQKLNCSNNENLTELILQNNTSIKELTANSTNLTTLDISNNTRLVSLSLKNNSLTSLDLSINRDLQYLDISNNNLSTLNLTNTVDLTNFIANNNQLTALNLTTAPNLVQFSASDNNLTTIDLRNGNSANIQNYNTLNNLSLTCVEVDDVVFANRNFIDKDSQTQFYLDCNFYGQIYIHDANFEQELINLNIDDALDSYLSKNDASAVTELILDNKNIADLTGIEGFVNLQKLSISDNNLTYIDVRRNQELLELNCSNNNLEELDVTFNTKLIDLKCESNQIKYINLKPLVNLVSTTIANNVIENLDLSENLKLEFFEAQNNNLFCIQVKDVAFAEANWTDNVDDNVVFLNDCNIVQILDANLEEALVELGIDDFVDGYVSQTNLDNVISLNVSDKNISDLSIISQFTNLERLFCSTNNLTSLDVSNNLKLVQLACSYNDLTSLNLSENVDLESLSCNVNELTSLNLTNNTKLKFVFASYNNLSNIALNSIDKIIKLTCNNNELTELNITNLTELTELNCSNNDILELNVTQNLKLESLRANETLISEIDVLNNSELISLQCSQNSNLNSLNLSNNTKLKYLSIGYSNFNNTIDISNNTALEQFYCESNSLQSLDVSNNLNLSVLYAPSNEFTSLNLQNNTLLTSLTIDYNQLTSLDLSSNNELVNFWARGNDLTCIQVADVDFATINWSDRIDENANFNTDCSNIWTVNTDPTTQTALDAVPNLDTDNDGKITLAEAAAFQGGLDLANKNLTSVAGLQAFTSITILDISGNNITDLSPLTGLDIEIISKTGKTKMVHKKSSGMALEFLYANDNQIIKANLDALTNLKEVDVSNNPELVTLSLKNGNNSAITYFDSRNTPKLSCIIVDDKNAAYLATFNKDAANNFVDDEADCRSSVLSTEDAFLLKDVSIYPNPVTNFLTLESTKEFDFIEIYNSIGKRVIKTEKRLIDFSSYTSGIYMMRIIAENKVLTKKVIKN